MAKVRVSALAKEVGVTSKVLLERLNGMGEYVKSASSTVEAPVVRRYQEKFPMDTPSPAPSAPKPAGKAPAAPAAPASAPAATPGPTHAAPRCRTGRTVSPRGSTPTPSRGPTGRGPASSWPGR